MAVDKPTPPAAAQEQAPQQPPPPIPLKDTIFRFQAFQLYGPSLRSSHTRTVQIRLSVSCVFYPR